MSCVRAYLDQLLLRGRDPKGSPERTFALMTATPFIPSHATLPFLPPTLRYKPRQLSSEPCSSPRDSNRRKLTSTSAIFSTPEHIESQFLLCSTSQSVSNKFLSGTSSNSAWIA